MANGEAGAFFASNYNLILLDQLADVLKTHGRFMQFDSVVLGKSVNKVCGRDGFRHAVFPTPAFDEVVEEERNNIVGLNECSIFIDDADRKSTRLNSSHRTISY